MGVGIVELDVFEALRPAAPKLLAQVPLEARAARIDLALAISRGGVRGMQIGAVLARIVLIEQIAVADADAVERGMIGIIADHENLAVLAGDIAIASDQIAQPLAFERIAALRRREHRRIAPRRAYTP